MLFDVLKTGKIVSSHYILDKNMKKVDLVNNFGMSSSTVAKMSKGESVSMSILIKLCDELECDFGDLIHYER